MSKSRMKRINEQKAETEASSTESTESDSPTPGRLVNANLVRVRMTPYYKSDNVIGTVGQNDEFKILGTYGEFRKVILSNGRVGFMASKFCEVAS